MQISLPKNNHITRYLKPNQYFIDEVTLKIVAIENAFYPRPLDKDKLSVNWLEYYGNDREVQLDKLRKAPGYPYNKDGKGKLALFNVGYMVEKVKSLSDNQFQLDVYHSPTESTPSHASIINVPSYDSESAYLRLFDRCLAKSIKDYLPAIP